ncbi:hypothetical protein DFH06DRAFT_1337596 [Mycena polygramma]|nr:hypothetical protein DFH06DRAFT_1337596 [Mycena polygramma]
MCAASFCASNARHAPPELCSAVDAPFRAHRPPPPRSSPPVPPLAPTPLPIDVHDVRVAQGTLTVPIPLCSAHGRGAVPSTSAPSSALVPACTTSCIAPDVVPRRFPFPYLQVRARVISPSEKKLPARINTDLIRRLQFEMSRHRSSPLVACTMAARTPAAYTSSPSIQARRGLTSPFTDATSSTSGKGPRVSNIELARINPDVSKRFIAGNQSHDNMLFRLFLFIDQGAGSSNPRQHLPGVRALERRRRDLRLAQYALSPYMTSNSLKLKIQSLCLRGVHDNLTGA